MKKVVTPMQMRDIDSFMIDKMGIPGSLLMENAAECVCKEVKKILEKRNGSVLILCGTGNNGGDGLALLRKLAVDGIPARAVLLGEGNKLPSDAKLNYEIAKASGLSVKEITQLEDLKNELSAEFSVVVDAIFGIGLKREIEGIEKEAVVLCNFMNAYKIAIDVPTGVDGHFGHILGCAFKADMTVTFQHLKRGLLLYPGREYAGRVIMGAIGLLNGYPSELKEEVLEEDDIKRLLPHRKPDAHKGDNGKCFLAAGSLNLSGAAFMCVSAALRAGCGLLKVAVPKYVKPHFFSLPEAMVFEAAEEDWKNPDVKSILDALNTSTCAAIGPGMGTAGDVGLLVGEVLSSGLPAVIDADGLNALALNRKLFGNLHDKIILTPHPAEMSRLTGKALHKILEDPVFAAGEAAAKWGCIVHLKGATSITASPGGSVSYNVTGNPGLAKGGSGDVLTGIILAMLGQKLSSYDAARTGAYLLGCSADKAFDQLGSRMLTASDIIDVLI